MGTRQPMMSEMVNQTISLGSDFLRHHVIKHQTKSSLIIGFATSGPQTPPINSLNSWLSIVTDYPEYLPPSATAPERNDHMPPPI